MKIVKQTKCSVCGRTGAIVYQPQDSNRYNLYCFSCGRKEGEIKPELYQDVVMGAMLAILGRINQDAVKKVPKTATWRDVQVTILGLLDVQALENARFRKFFREHTEKDSLQLSFYHLLKTIDKKLDEAKESE